MRGIYTPVTDIRRKVFTEVARMAYEVNEMADLDYLMKALPYLGYQKVLGDRLDPELSSQPVPRSSRTEIYRCTHLCLSACLSQPSIWPEYLFSHSKVWFSHLEKLLTMRTCSLPSLGARLAFMLSLYWKRPAFLYC